MRPTHRIAPARAALGVLAASALVAGMLGAAPAGASGSSGQKAAAPDPLTIDGSVVYKCAATAAGLSLGDYLVNVRLTSEVPPLAPQGATLPATEVGIQLTMPEGLRGATSALGATEAEGGSDDSSVTVQVAGADPVSLALENVTAPRAPIPQKFGQPWIINSTGTTPAGVVNIPSDATGSVKLSAPTAFSVQATLFREGGDDVDTALDCTSGASAAQKLQAIIPITTPAPPSPDAIKTTPTLTFGCSLTVGQNTSAAGVGVIWAYPALPTAAEAGSTYPSVPQGYIIAVPSTLRQALYNQGLRSIQALGGTSNMTIVTDDDVTDESVPLNGIVSAPTPIADGTGAPVVVQTQPTLASWTVPSTDYTLRAGGTFSSPLKFTTDDPNTSPTGSISCSHVTFDQNGQVVGAGDPTLRNLVSGTPYTQRVKTSTTVTASNVKVTYGQAANVIANVSPLVDGGTISITYKGKKLASGDAGTPVVLATAKVTKGAATLTLPAKSLKPGRYVLNVVYSGDATHKSALGRTIVRVAPLASSVSVESVTPETIVATRTHAIVKANVTSTAAEENGEAVTGIVRVLSGGREYGRGKVTDGVANVRLDTFPKAGDKNLRVIYVGNSTVGSSSTTTSITVVPKN